MNLRQFVVVVLEQAIQIITELWAVRAGLVLGPPSLRCYASAASLSSRPPSFRAVPAAGLAAAKTETVTVEL